jgi:E3 ubiquitin-protein ligase TRIP12
VVKTKSPQLVSALDIFSSDLSHMKTGLETPKLTPSSRTRKAIPPPNDTDVVMEEANKRHDAEDPDHDEEMADRSAGEDEDRGDDEERYADEDYERDDDEDEDDDDVFDDSYLSPGGANLSNTLRALSGLVSGISSRLRDILENLRQRDDPSAQLIALQSLAELLLVSTEDNLSGHFSPDQFVKELVSLMQDQGPYGENPEMMLLACRCIANLMEALPAATANVVYGGAVPVLCAKLMEIQYIDLAEQALSVSFSRLSVRSSIT